MMLPGSPTAWDPVLCWPPERLQGDPCLPTRQMATSCTLERPLDSALPFGLRSAPKIFSAVADALEWVMHQHGISNSLHYLDDYLFLGSPGTKECADALRTALDVCNMLGFPVAIHKIEGPSPVLSFLDIEIDTVTWQLRQKARHEERPPITARTIEPRRLSGRVQAGPSCVGSLTLCPMLSPSTICPP